MDTDNRYSRQIMLPEFGEKSQDKLIEAKVLIVGLGGLGAPVASYLTGAGIGLIGLCDADTVSVTNLHRQILYTSKEIGKRKTDMALQRLKSQNHEVGFIRLTDGLTDENALDTIKSFDLVIDCTDNLHTRFLIDRACTEANIPWIYGAIEEFAGQVSVMNFGSNPRHLSDLFPEYEKMPPKPKTIAGVLGPVPGVIGSIQACEAIKVLTGIGEPLAGRLFMIDLLSMYTQIIEL